MNKAKLDRAILKKFGIVMGIGFLVITLILFIKEKQNLLPLISLSLLFFICSLTFPLVLKPIYLFWMKLAFILGWFNTRLLLSIVYFAVFTPIGIIMKLFKVDPLNRKIEKEKDSYWIKKESKDFNSSDYEKQF